MSDICVDCGEPHGPEDPFEDAWGEGFDDGFEAALEKCANDTVLRKEAALITVAAAVAGGSIPAAILQVIQERESQKETLTESDVRNQVEACAKIAAEAAKAVVKALGIFPDLSALAPNLTSVPDAA